MRLYSHRLEGIMKRCLLISFFAAVLAGGAAAQSFEDYQRRHADLAALSAIFGELHHIRRTCEPRFEGDVWRERMKKLIDLEDPQASLREQMVANFNQGYRRAQQRFSRCDRRARDYAAARAAQGDVIVERLTAPLEEAIEDDETPFTWSAPTTPQTIPDRN